MVVAVGSYLAPFTVSGTLVSSKPLQSGAVVIGAADRDADTSLPSDNATIRPDGTFTFNNVPSGDYQLRARAEVEGDPAPLFAAYKVRVGSADVKNVRLSLAPGGRIRGTLTFTGQAPRTHDGLRVRTAAADGHRFGDARPVTVGASGSFDIQGVMPGRHFISVEGLPHPWILDQVHWRGRDLVDLPVDVQSRQVLEDVRLTVSESGAEVTGLVRGADGTPAARALVVVAPLAQQFWTTASRRFALTQSDDGGRYRITGLPPGEYRAAAPEGVDEAAAARPRVIGALVAHGSPLLLTARESRELDLTRIRADAAR